MNPVKVGLVGTGLISAEHAESYLKMPEKAEIVAVCDIKEELVRKRAEEWGVGKWFTDYDKMFKTVDMDAVDIMVPHDEHLRITKAAASAGKHILLEKPIARSVEEAQEILGIIKERGVKLMIANNLLFHPVVEKLRFILHEGNIGKIAHVRAYSLGWLFYSSPNNFRLSKEKTGGGTLLDSGIHFSYLLRNTIGEVESVVAFNANVLNDLHDFTPEGEDVATLILRFEKNILGCMTISYSTKLPGWRKFFSGVWDQEIDIYGSEGAICVNLSRNTVRLFCDKKEVIDEKVSGWIDIPPEEDGMAYRLSYQKEVQHFINCLISGEEFFDGVRGESALKDLRVITAAYESSKRGRIMRIK